MSYIFISTVSPCTLPANSLMESLAHIWIITDIGCMFIERLENQAQRMDGNPGELALGTTWEESPLISTTGITGPGYFCSLSLDYQCSSCLCE